MSVFRPDMISDQKRLVRGEQLLYSRGRLRIRDGVHHAKWKVLILAGGAPRGEIQAIRELMLKAHVVAVDKDAQCLEHAAEAGADRIVQCDLADFVRQTAGPGSGFPARLPPAPIMAAGPFDLIALDLCAGVSDETQNLVRVYRRKEVLASDGIFIVTFSYGRDVVEALREYGDTEPSLTQAQGPRRHEAQREAQRFLKEQLPLEMVGRLVFLLGHVALPWIHSLMLYRGAHMPMCSVLLQPGRDMVPSVVRVEPGDYEIAVAHPDPALMYDCPQDRIEALRRSHAAIKASYTRASMKAGSE